MIYDSFFKNYQIISKLVKFRDVRDHFIKYGIPLNDMFIGYLYFVEISILTIIKDIEYLIKDESLSERINWGEITIDDRELNEELKMHPEGKYIISLNSIRKKISQMRFKSEYDEISIENQLNILY